MILKKNKCVALIPARSGSKRIKNKNIRQLCGHPLLAYTIVSARQAGIFSRIVVSTDSEEIAKVAKYYGAEVPFLRPKKFAHDVSPDIEWIKHTLESLISIEKHLHCFAILRPTSPFRHAGTLRKAWEQFLSDREVDSLRAVELCRQHPAKMWFLEGNRIKPIMIGKDEKGNPWHSKPYQSLPRIFAQNASLEIAWCHLPLKHNSISGKKITPFFTYDFEGYDINDEKDWFYAEKLIRERRVKLPVVKKRSYVK